MCRRAAGAGRTRYSGRTAGLLAAWAAGAGAGCGSDSAAPPPVTGTPNEPPVAAFSVDVSEGSAPLEVRFDGSASSDPDGSIASYAWSFGDGGTGSGRTVDHTYENVGSYTPRLTVTDDRGATATQTGNPITVDSPPGTGENEIAGMVWHDANADGVRDPDEQAIPSMVVFLDADGDGVRDSTEVVAVTDSAGAYRFEGLDGRQSYTVTQELTIGWTNTSPGTTSSHPAPATGPVGPTVLPIIGGEFAMPGEFPFQIALLRSGTLSLSCGGTFIAASWVLTAAHCVDGATAADVKVLAGTHDLNSGGELLDVARLYIHPAYSSRTALENDIALLELVGEHRYPRIELLTPERTELAAPGTVATTIGWGVTSDGGNISSELKKLEAAIISNDECSTHLDTSILGTTICAGMQGSSESICNGDSGGPLMVPFRGRWLQVGIVSFGTNICYQPTAFGRVSELLDFPLGRVPVERSGAVVVDWSGGGTTAEANFGNFR